MLTILDDIKSILVIIYIELDRHGKNEENSQGQNQNPNQTEFL